MGILHLVCPASNLGITTEDVVCFLVAHDGKRFAPIAPGISGTYDSYGGIEDVDADAVSKRVLAGFKELKKEGNLGVEAKGETNLDGDPSLKNIEALLADIRQGQVDETWVRAVDRRVGFILVLDGIHEAAIAAVRATAEGKALEKTLKGASFDALVQATLDAGGAKGKAGALPRMLVEDDEKTRAALVRLGLFRNWFDEHAAWKPEPLGEQYSSTELRVMVKKAIKDLAEWPPLVKAVRAYESELEDDEEEDDEDDEDLDDEEDDDDLDDDVSDLDEDEEEDDEEEDDDDEE
jgi:hypothetical protein